ncbi:MAG: hypothetical protein HQL76_18015 [Magnetococcales bacterium]|nr:hypothetical protein [Magnetococcales bacterium]MBF0111065.1 hypothetical protein [Magnetococcales bacterium]
METLAIIDFETTGLSPSEGARATEIAAIVMEDGRIVRQYQSLMNAGVGTGLRLFSIERVLMLADYNKRNFLYFSYLKMFTDIFKREQYRSSQACRFGVRMLTKRQNSRSPVPLAWWVKESGNSMLRVRCAVSQRDLRAVF